MTTDQEAENATASVHHLLIQRGIDARNWQAQAEQHEGTLQALRTQRDELLLSLAAANRECGVLTGERDELQRQLDERERNNANLQEEIAALQASRDRAPTV